MNCKSKGPQNRGKGKNSQLFSTAQQQKRLSITKNDEMRKSYDQDSIPKCQVYRTRQSVDDLRNPLEDPQAPLNYNQPFRRNFRYFGYPKDLNLHLNTPPRVKSWGPALEQAPKTKPKRKPFKLTKDKSFDPYWIGRLMKSNLLLENPGLIPVVEKAVENLGEESVNWVHPDFEHTDCTSELYFPLSEKSRKGFCRINKIIQEIVDKEVHDYTVQNRTIVKTKRLEGEVRKSETEIGFKPPLRFGKKSNRKSNFSITDFRTRTPENLFYNKRTIPPILKSFCIAENYPGMNVQPYERPIRDDDEEDNVVVKEYESPITGVVRIPVLSSNVPDDVWNQLSRVRVRRNILEKQETNSKGFRTFNQHELRNHVMQDARQDFVARIKKDVYTPLPAELFQENRNVERPPHDFIEKGEYPPQGPFWWKEEQEPQPELEELKIIDKFIDDQKKHHAFTHHLPGLLYAPRHPFPTLDLDWIEMGTEMHEVSQARKTPHLIHDMPEYIMSLEPQKFQEKFETAVMEGAKDLVGPEIYELYRKKHGMLSPSVTEEESVEEIPVVHIPKKKKVRKPLKVDTEAKKELSPEDNEEENEEEDEGEEEEEEREVEAPEEDEYRLDVDLEEVALEEFPYPDVRFSSIEFPKAGIPPGLKDDLKFFKKQIERATPVPKDTEEPMADDDSTTTTESESEILEPEPSSSRHDAISHLQVMYQEAVKSKYRSMHRHPKNQAELEPPPLKNIFLMDDYTEDIDHLLHHNDNIPKFLQLF